jgi:hypothetical protein
MHGSRDTSVSVVRLDDPGICVRFPTVERDSCPQCPDRFWGPVGTGGSLLGSKAAGE